MNCPQCNHIQICPCPRCQSSNPTERPWKWLKNGETIQCGNCTYVMSADEWEALSMQEYRKDRLP